MEDQECGVCYLHYSRIDRVPRTLHCNHTFCTPCLEAMGQHSSGLRTIRCPFCRQVTCVGQGLSLQEALFVNSQLWDNICEEQEEEEDEREQEKEKEGKNTNMQALPSSQAECQVPKHCGSKFRLPAFLKRMNLSSHPEERIVPTCNIQMMSWRRLSSEEII
ncbi:E3 ubiquitin-protein ligase rnf168-like isoform X1 [Carassius auratus]|uniref:E3 ubiquitin-protein ligase rnf168-like isoform X1 n=2 Tax=Carassius auratus TaxID=7957 RepID=A0A6P6PGB7_CARAU|nr:E3 ubiquitin-protein ligase rnf168-like isoform X1 [Carassius auratus]XP_026119828.1 E3 ubiquitin-protein ligase rnf168-like isoform X1 [Carassius auratus]